MLPPMVPNLTARLVQAAPEDSVVAVVLAETTTRAGKAATVGMVATAGMGATVAVVGIVEAAAMPDRPARVGPRERLGPLQAASWVLQRVRLRAQPARPSYSDPASRF